jgi:ATP-binding cassette subfamily G (WHITE) protein 2
MHHGDAQAESGRTDSVLPIHVTDSPVCVSVQDDNFVATMTSLETLNFYASITLPSSWSKAERKDRVADVLGAMGLKHRGKTMVGGTLPGGLMLRGLSGGERKRLSIAAGILAAPSVIFLDEPTSGLDSFAALSVMGHLKRMARDSGHAVIASIHQPRAAIWNMFDKVSDTGTHRKAASKIWGMPIC